MAEVRVPALVLAAGGGSRLGGRPKALLSYRGRPLLEHALAAARAGGCAGTVAVLGAAAEQVRARVETGDCRLVDNPDWRTGLGSSLRAGLDALPPDATAVLVLLVDTPGVTAEAVRRLLAAHTARTDLAACAWAGRRAHPVLIGAAHFPELHTTATHDTGARTLLATHPVTLVDCTDTGDPTDLDTPTDLTHWGIP
ncbi:NTP transferase domain-containing protein [Kitasatospora sp. NPDC088134]|uniref:nucleotidyltransferase family protein n=1 Tax=Kitasatospora sp. NPDC088134 TaxID=3364071 RepID=UPI003828013F